MQPLCWLPVLPIVFDSFLEQTASKPNTSYETETNGFCVILRSAARFSFTRTLRHRFADFVAYRGPRTVPIVPIGLSHSFAQPLGRSTASLSTCLLAPIGTANTAHVMERTSKTSIPSTSLPISKKKSCHQLLDKHSYRKDQKR